MTEPLLLRRQVKASLVYDERFPYEPLYLWSNPGGTYQSSDTVLRVYDMDFSGNIKFTFETTMNDVGSQGEPRGGYERPQIFLFGKAGWDPGRFSNYNPEEDRFNDCLCIDGSKTVLEPLVKRTMHYVFRVPNIVVKEEGFRVFALSVGDNEYQLIF